MAATMWWNTLVSSACLYGISERRASGRRAAAHCHAYRNQVPEQDTGPFRDHSKVPSITIRHYPRAATMRQPDIIKQVRLKTPASQRKRRSKAPTDALETVLKPDHEDRLDNPAMMDFNNMYRQLELWQMRYGDSHVPRFVHDNSQLGHWCKFVRRGYKRGDLPQWQVDQLNLLGFSWRPSKQEAMWYFFCHELRRFKEQFGHTDVQQYEGADSDFLRLGVWVRRQALVFAKGKLPEKRQAMLRRLGVKLRVDLALVKRYAQLQGLNAMERRRLRKSWKHEWRAEAAKRQAAREVERGELQQQELLQHQQQEQRELLQQARQLQASCERLKYFNGMPLLVPVEHKDPGSGSNRGGALPTAVGEEYFFDDW